MHSNSETLSHDRRHTAGCLTLIAMTVAVTGCLPEKRIVWDPKGDKAAVCTPNGLYFMDPTGRLLPARLEDTPARAAWLPDGSELVVIHTTKARSWADLAGLFNAEQTQRIEEESRKLGERALAYDDDWDKFDVDPGKKLGANVAAVLLYLREHPPEGLPERMDEKWAELQEIKPAVWQLQRFGWTAEKLTPGQVLVSTLEELREPKVSASGKLVAFLRSIPGGDREEPNGAALHVVPVDRSAARAVASPVALGYDWSPDGRALAFIRGAVMDQSSDESVQLGSLTRITVADASGSLLDKFEGQKELVGLLFTINLGVQWLRDGRLLFASTEVTLPATTSEMPQSWNLYCIDPRMPASAIRMLGRDVSEQLTRGFPLFEVSPDQKRVLLAGDKGRVYLHEFESGQTKTLCDQEDPKGQTISPATWRNNAEVTLLLPGAAEGGKARRDVASWKDGVLRRMSGEWPDSVRDGWLNEN